MNNQAHLGQRILQCVFQLISVSEARLDALAVINQDFLNQVDDALPVQLRQMPVLLELFNPLDVPELFSMA